MEVFPVVFITWDALKYVVGLSKRQFNYMISSESYAQELQTNVGKLKHQVDWINFAREEAKENSRHVLYRIEDWLGSAEKASEEAGELLGNFEVLRKTCCYWSLPDHKCRYQFSKMASYKIKEILALTGEGNKYSDLDQISPMPLMQLGEDAVFKSRAMKIRDIMEALANKSNSVVGVYGCGGVGKSTLLEEVKRIISKEKSFDWVAKANLSQYPDIKMIQGEIANALGLTEIQTEETISRRAELLRQRLEDEEKKKRAVLIILDDFRPGLDLKLIGIPYGPDDKVKGCQLLVTSTNRNDLRREMDCKNNFRLDGLKAEEAEILFDRMVGEKVQDEEVRLLAEAALDKCAGVPFLIVAMAQYLKVADSSEWKDTVKKIRKFEDKTINVSAKQILQLNYDKLKEEMQLFLNLCVGCGVFKPSLENLVRYGIGLRLFQGDLSMKKARDRSRSHIRTLQASSLLLMSEDVGSFKIHDLIHDFVASVASILVVKGNDRSITQLSKDKLKNCKAMCFPYVDMKDFPQELDCPNLEMFLLFSNNESLHVPDSFFNSMKKLKVINFTGISLTHPPSSFESLESLHTLCLDDCLLEDVTILGKLKRLQILSFVGSNIQRLPEEIGKLKELRLLDLNRCSQLKTIEPGVLRSLNKLKELYMECSFDQWDAVDQTPPTNASLIELNDMKSLSTLHLSISNPSVLPGDLNVQKLEEYIIKIGFMGSLRSKCEGSTTLELKLEPISNVLQKGCIQSIWDKTDDLFLYGLDSLVQSVCALSKKGFPQLKHLDVQHSPSVHYILEQPSLPAFKKLETLLLRNLVNLEKICPNQICTTSFNTLKVVRVVSCEKMEVLFPLSVMRGLPQLEEIEVADCELMCGIVEEDDCGKLEFPKLLVLKLRDLPNIRSFFTDGSASLSRTLDDQVGSQVAFFNAHQVQFPRLESMALSHMDNLSKIWTDNPQENLTFDYLKKVEAQNCKSLVNLFPYWVARSLNQIKELRVESCGMKEIVAGGDDIPRTNTSQVLFPKLTSLLLHDMPQLKSFSPNMLTLNWPSLEKLEMTRCNQLKKL